MPAQLGPTTAEAPGCAPLRTAVPRCRHRADAPSSGRPSISGSARPSLVDRSSPRSSLGAAMPTVEAAQGSLPRAPTSSALRLPPRPATDAASSGDEDEAAIGAGLAKTVKKAVNDSLDDSALDLSDKDD